MKKTVFVTGGSRGIGRAIVEKFAKEGFDVAFIYKENDEAAKEVSETTGALSMRCDVRDLSLIHI